MLAAPQVTEPENFLISSYAFNAIFHHIKDNQTAEINITFRRRDNIVKVVRDSSAANTIKPTAAAAAMAASPCKKWGGPRNITCMDVCL